MEVVKDPDNTARERLTRMVEAYQQPLLTICFSPPSPNKTGQNAFC